MKKAWKLRKMPLEKNYFLSLILKPQGVIELLPFVNTAVIKREWDDQIL